MNARIVFLKYEARRHYEAYMEATDHLDCGHHMAQIISADAALHARKFDQAMAELATLDPSAPKARLSA